MSLKNTPELHVFLSTGFPDSDPGEDEELARGYATKTAPERVTQVIAQAKALLARPELPVEDFGMEANRWFGDGDEARAWLTRIVSALEASHGAAGSGGDSLVVKDSNGTPLAEGDSVQVIKDLKVKGGSSDLKRGTMIKKIHLTGDPDAIECRVDGSTLVLKTCFLKKA